MSVKSLISQPEVRGRLDLITPALDRLPPLEVRVPPFTARYGLVGTAFDYALRFELQRRNPHALARTWVAEAAVERIPKAAEIAGISKKEARRLAQLGKGIVEEAQGFIAGYLSKASPTEADHRALATHAIRLAKLDNVFRAYQLDPALDQVDLDDAQDVVSLLGIVPFGALSHPKVMLLNPTFGTYSHVAGGADADLICGDLLVDFKTTKNAEIKREMVRQVIVYLMLARCAREEDGLFPDIGRFGLYFSRQAHLWTIPATEITGHPRYMETEAWLIQHATATEMDPELRELWKLTSEEESKVVRRRRQPRGRKRGTSKPSNRRVRGTRRLSS